MGPALVIPAVVASFLGGVALGKPRRPLSMLPAESPLAGIPRSSWHEFVRVMIVAPAGARSSRGRLGLFGLTPRHLADIGLMSGLRKVAVGSELGVWVGEWRPPLDEANFLASVPAQYAAFARTMREVRKAAEPHVGADVDGVLATLSGLLAVGYSAGARGVVGWVKDPDTRKKFKSTTIAFRKANAIF